MIAKLVAATAALVLAAGAARAETILFIGNSLTFGANSPVWKYRAGTVNDLNGTGVGGVPALFKLFTQEAGLDYTVSLETVGGTDFAFHLREKRALIDRAWDHVVLQGYSTLDQARPGDPSELIRDTPVMAQMFHARNPAVDIRLTATWSRADQTYPATGHWYGKPITAMARDVRRAYDQAAAATPMVKAVVPVGDAWNRAIETGFADANPYDGLDAGKIDLWTYDNYHASSFGYYLEALMVFSSVTGRDPLSLGDKEVGAAELGLSRPQTVTLQQLAHDELATLRPVAAGADKATYSSRSRRTAVSAGRAPRPSAGGPGSSRG
jgi:hypothetical protein